MIFTIAVTIVVLGVLIFVHELGHFAAAKSVDIEVPRFSIGLGPKMVGFRRGETEYVLNLAQAGDTEAAPQAPAANPPQNNQAHAAPTAPAQAQAAQSAVLDQM